VTINSSDTDLITGILQGDKSAFRLLYSRYARMFMLVCRRYFSNKEDAEDMLQESFVSIFKDLKQFDTNRGKFQYWGRKVVVNTCLQKLRKKTVLDDFDDLSKVEHGIGISPEVISKLSLEELTKIIHQLTPGQKLVFNLYVIDGFTHQEISQILGISVSTSKTQLMKAKRFLRTDLENNNYFNSGNYA